MNKNISKWIFCVALLTFALIVFLSLISFNKVDSSLFTSSPLTHTHNLIGIAGSFLASYLFFTFGKAAYLIVISFSFSALKRLNVISYNTVAQGVFTKVVSFLIAIASLSTLCSLFGDKTIRFANGGFIGYSMSEFFTTYMGKTGAIIVTVFLLTIGVSLLWTELFLMAYAAIKFKYSQLADLHAAKAVEKPAKTFSRPTLTSEAKPIKNKVEKPNLMKKIMPKKEVKPVVEKPIAAEPIKPAVTPAPAPVAKTTPQSNITINVKQKLEPASNKKSKPTTVKVQDMSYTLPTPDILSDLPVFNDEDSKKLIQEKARLLEQTLETFGVAAKVVNADQGPTITRYELDLAPGVKINRISNLSDDIAMALCAAQVRIVAPIPGKGTVGVELPNDIKKIVFLKECIQHESYTKKDSPTAFSMGQDVAGNPLVADIKEMPHMLIAGSTGAGKTVCINTLLCSLLFKASPWELKLILVDPKMVEMTQYADIPHLFTPIVSDAKKATSVLTWAVEEMERRYGVLAKEGARNIATFNERKPKEERMPYIVIVVDELADLMMVARDQIETAIARIAQLARAVGIHLVLATQRPSADIITGVIKNNLPARISFKVPTQIDSRVILDHTGAEKLLGKGDMLYIGPGLHKPIRVQGCFMKDEDIDTIVDFIKDQNIPVMYNTKIEEAQNKATAHGGERDAVLDEAIKVVLEAGQASASILQRRMRVGYNRAARLIDQMESEGIVGPFQGSKPRTILVDPMSFLSQMNNPSE